MSLSPLRLLKRLVPARIKLLLQSRRIDGQVRLRVPDRIFLEETVFPWFCEIAHVKAVLDVGCDWYTVSYPHLFGAERYETIDFDPEKAAFAKGREADHHVGSLLDLERFCDPASFDLVICNGVLGWGINDAESTAIAAQQMARCLRPGGWLVLGWNEMENYRPTNLEVFDRAPFSRFPLPPIEADTYEANPRNGHTFRFFQRGED